MQSRGLHSHLDPAGADPSDWAVTRKLWQTGASSPLDSAEMGAAGLSKKWKDQGSPTEYEFSSQIPIFPGSCQCKLLTLWRSLSMERQRGLKAASDPNGRMAWVPAFVNWATLSNFAPL